MKKAKNAFAIIAIVFGVIAAALLMLHPVIDGLCAGLTEGAGTPIAYAEHFDNVLKRIPALFDVTWFSSFSLEALKVHFALLLGALGVIILLVLLILMLCKKHAKGLGWWIPMLIVFALAVIVASVYTNPGSLVGEYEAAGKLAVNEMKYFELSGLISAIVSAALFIIAAIFYMVYVCKARSKEKKVAAEVAESKAEIHNLIKEALGK